MGVGYEILGHVPILFDCFFLEDLPGVVFAGDIVFGPLLEVVFF